MDEANPYAPPESELQSTSGGVWRKAGLLFMKRDAQLPPRCINCNKEAVPGKVHRIHYLNFWLQLAMLIAFILVNVFAIIPILILMLLFRKTAKIKIPLCRKHHTRRFWITLVTVGSLVLSILIAVISIRTVHYQDPALLASILLFVTAMILALVRGQLLRVNKIDKEVIIFKGAKKPFLDSLPEVSG